MRLTLIFLSLFLLGGCELMSQSWAEATELRARHLAEMKWSDRRDRDRQLERMGYDLSTRGRRSDTERIADSLEALRWGY